MQFLSFLYRLVPKHKRLSLVIICLMLIVVFVGLPSLWSTFSNAVVAFFRPPEIATVDLSNTITSAVVARGMLVTSESHQSNRDIHISVSRWIMNSGGYEASHFAQATIFAGVNLESNLVKVTKLDETHYEIMLPPAEITSCSLKPLTQYDQSTTAFGDWDAVLDLASYAAMTEFVNNSLSTGLLSEAETTAGIVLQDLLRTVVDDDVVLEIKFNKTQAPKIDDTCVVSVPREWEYSAEKGEWSRK